MVAFKKRYNENIVLQKICKYIVDVILIIMFAVSLVMFTCARTTIVGNSMKESLENGDVVLINRTAYILFKPKRFDIIAFKKDDSTNSKLYVKRIIGLPGDTVQIKDGAVYINDELLENDVNDEFILSSGIAANPVKLNEDEYFVLGDSRNNSEDSRFANVGIIKKDSIYGEVWFVIQPFSNLGIAK